MRDLSEIGKSNSEIKKMHRDEKNSAKKNREVSGEYEAKFPLEEKSVEDCISESISKKTEKESHKKGWIIGGCVGGGVAVLVAVALVFLWPKAPGGITTPVIPISEIDIQSSEMPDSLKKQAEGKVEQKKDVYTFIIGGVDKDGTRTDVLMTLTLDLKNNSLNLLSIPRDSMVRASTTSSGVRKINSAYGTKSGIENTKASVANILGYYANRYCIVNLDSFVELIDAVGGVWYDVPRDMNYDDPTQDLHIHLKKGYQLLDGAHAIQLVRFRKGYSNADLGRIETTQGFLRALFSTLTQPKNITKFKSYADLLIHGTNTDLSSNELIWLATKASSIDAEKIQMFTAPGYSKMAYGASYYILKEDELLSIVNEYMNPLTADIENVDIVSGGNDTTGHSSGKTTPTPKPTVKPSPKDTPTPSPEPSGKPDGEVTPEPTADPEPTPETTPEPTAEATPEPTAAPEPTEDPEPTGQVQ